MFNINEYYRTANNATALVLARVVQDFEGKRKTLLVGYVVTSQGLLHPARWTDEGAHESNPLLTLVQPIQEFGIGKWRTISPDHVAVVTTVSPHESSRFRLIGYVMDSVGRMTPKRWTFSGRCSDYSDHDLNKNVDHSKLPF